MALAPARTDDQARTDAAFRAALFAAWAPRPRLTVSEIAERDLVLSREYSKEPGPIRLARTPFLRDPMDCLSPDHPAQTVVFLGPVQIVAAHDGPRKSGLRISGHDGRVILDRVFLAVLTA